MKKVEILVRNFTGGDGKMFGKGGKYDVSDYQAETWEREGKAKIIEDLGNDYKPAPASVKNPQFLQLVRDHASDIMEIMNQEFDRQRKVEQLKREAEESGILTMGGQPGPQDGVTGNESADGVTGNEGAAAGGNEGNDGLSVFDQSNGGNQGGGQQEIDPDAIPEDFPGAKALSENEPPITKLSQVKEMTEEQLIAVNGIGEKLAARIQVRLTEDAEAGK